MPDTFGRWSSRIFLWSMQRVCSNIELASFWFRHYAALGIHMHTNTHIVVHSTSGEEMARARQFLYSQNVSQFTFVQEFSSAIKTAMVNEFIRNGMPSDGWLLYADADEFFGYPLDVVRLMRHSHALCSSMIDRLSSDLMVPRVRAWDEGPSLPTQFSLCAPLRQRIAPGGGWMKLTLIRARIRGAPPTYINTHVASVNATKRLLRFGGNGRQRCTYTGSFSHYMHSEQGYAILRDKLALYERIRRRVSLQVYRAHLALIEQRGVTGGQHRFTAAAALLIRNETTGCPAT